MRANLIGLAILLAITGAALLRAEPARCDSCITAGMTCYGDIACGSSCRCIRINGMAKPGVCG